MKVNNYFYQFDLEKEWKTSQEILSLINNNLISPEYRLWNDYEKLKIKVDIISITNSESWKDWEYRITIQKWIYGYKMNFIPKNFDYKSIDWEKQFYWTDSWKELDEMEEIHYYSSLKIWISDNWKYVRWIISIPRIRNWITTSEISDLLKIVFDNLLWKWFYRELIPAYSEWKILEVFSTATKINFIKDVYIDDLIWKEKISEEWRTMSQIKMSVSWFDNVKKWVQYFSWILSKSKKEINQELSPLRHLQIVTKKWKLTLESDEFKLCNTIEIEEYINILTPIKRSEYTNNNLSFINSNYKNHFIN
jgi:hypothetical protein